MKDIRNIIIRGQLSEKGTRLMEKENKYFFIVDRSANKIDVKRAVEALYKVAVTKVGVMNYPGKKKRERTRNYGRTSSWRRAIVTLQQGDKIDLTT